MTTKDEALKLALEALEDYVEEYGPHEKDSGAAYSITAIREALAQPEGCQCPECQIKPHASDCAVHNAPAYPIGKCDCGAQLEQKPAFWTRKQWGMDREFCEKPFTTDWEPLYTTPPQHKPLMDENLRKLADKHLFYQSEGYEVSGVFTFARAIEQAHGIKGEA